MLLIFSLHLEDRVVHVKKQQAALPTKEIRCMMLVNIIGLTPWSTPIASIMLYVVQLIHSLGLILSVKKNS